MIGFGLRDHHSYQDHQCSLLSDTDLILGMIAAYRRKACDADHHSIDVTHLPSDVCRMFRYPDDGLGCCIGNDHFNVRWFQEWCQANRP